MADFWHDANTVRVVRRAPYATSAAKVLPLHRRVLATVITYKIFRTFGIDGFF